MTEGGEYAGPDRRREDNSPLMILVKALHRDVTDMRGALGKLTDAITRLALIDERQVQAAKSMERAFEILSDLQKRTVELEKRLPLVDQQVTSTGLWFDRLVMLGLGAAATWIGKALGLL